MTEYFQIKDGVLEAYMGREEVVVVPEHVHTIGAGALKACTSLKKLILPSGLRCIMDGAFKGCRKLEKVEIPQSVTDIGSYAFHRCHALKQIVLPPSIEKLGDCVFLYCDSLTKVHIPGVKRLGKQVFVNDVMLETLEISPDLEPDCICDVFTGCERVTKISFAGGACFSFPNVVEAVAGRYSLPRVVRLVVADILRMMELEDRCLIRFQTNLKHVELPEGIESLAKSCFFDKRGILSVTFPKSLKKIGSRAFRNCINLEEVHFEGTQVEIEADAFKNCTSLKKICICGRAEYMLTGIAGLSENHSIKDAEYYGRSGQEISSEVPELVKTIHHQVMGNFRISGTILLQYLGEEPRVVVPDGITRIAEEAFAGNEAVDRILLPESVQEIGAEAFRDCLLLQSITFPAGLCRIGAGAFEHCVKLIRANLPSKINKIEARTFRHCHILREICFPEGLDTIGDSAFYGCRSLVKVQFPERLESIGEMAFYQCSGLKEVRIPQRTEYIKSLAFAKSGVRNVRIASSGKAFGTDIFGNCPHLRSLELEEGVQHISDKLAYGCAMLEQVTVPTRLLSVGRHALEGTRFLTQWIQKQQEDVITGARIEDSIFWDGRNLEGSVRLSEHVRIVAGGAFYGNTKITEVYLPQGVYWIGRAAWKGCRRLQKAVLPAGFKQLEAEVFSGCVELEEVTAYTVGAVEDSAQCANLYASAGRWQYPAWQVIGKRAFYQCSKLRNIRLDHAKRIGKEAFAGCRKLERCTMKFGVEIGERAFEDTIFIEHNLLENTMENTCSIIGGTVVSGERCSGEVYLSEGIRRIAPYAFAGNRRITKVVLPKGLQQIGEGAFVGCSSLLAVEFPQTLRRVEACAFEKCSSLTEVELPSWQVGAAAFSYCTALIKAVVPNVSILAEYLFAGCVNLETCVCDSAKVVKPYCFSGCRSLLQFSFDKLYVIQKYAFERCESLRYASFRDNACLLEHAFEDCCGLEQIVLSGVQGSIKLWEYAFSGCTALCQVICQGTEWTFQDYRDILSEDLPEMVRLMFHSAMSCFVVKQEERLCGYRGAARYVKIPEGIRRIEAEVFRDMLMLEDVEIPKSVEYIGARAFHQTAWLARQQRKSPMVVVKDMLLDGSHCTGEVVVPETIRLVCGWAFANGMEIEKIHFLSNRVHVEDNAFRNCIFLREIILPDGTSVHFTGIEDRKKELPRLAKQAVMDSLNCFKTDEEGVLIECTGNISVLQVAYGITAIGEGAFQDGNLLTKITLPETVKRIGKQAFAGCKWLKEVRQAQGIESIGEQAFSGCSALEYVELSDNFQQIGARAFENCTSLREIRIPEGVEELPQKVFYRCHSLKNIQFPSTLKKIGKDAFAFCRGLGNIALPEGILMEE